MGRIFFFIREGMRALRRSAAPSLAAIVTVSVTVLLLGVLIPVLQTTNGKTNQVRDQVGLRVFLNDVDPNDAGCPGGSGQQAPPAEVQALKAKLVAIPHVQYVQFVDKNQAKTILSQRLQSENREDIVAQLPGAHNPAAGVVQRHAGRPLQPARACARRSPRPARMGSRPRSAR